MEGEKYQPTPEEIKQAEDTMTDEQKMQSDARAEGYGAGEDAGYRKAGEEYAEQKQEKEVRETKPATFERAMEIMGAEFFCGPEKVKEIWGIEVENVPEIPFSEGMLEKARELKMILQFMPELDEEFSSVDALQHLAHKRSYESQKPEGNYKSATIKDERVTTTFVHGRGEKDTFLEEEMKKKEPVNAGWKLVQTKCLPETIALGDKAKIEQEISIKHFVRDFFEGLLDEEQYKLIRLLRRDGVVDEFKESATEAYFRMVNEKKMGFTITPAWTKSRFEYSENSFAKEDDNARGISNHAESKNHIFDIFLEKRLYQYALIFDVLGEKIASTNRYGDYREYTYPPTTVVIDGAFIKKLKE